MRSLFWRLFLLFSFVQLLGSLCVGLVVRTDMLARHEAHGPGLPGPPLVDPAWLGHGPGPGLPPGSASGPQPALPDAMPPAHARMGGPPPHPWPWLGVLTISAVNLLFAGLMARMVSRPLRRLREGFDAVARGQLETRLGPAFGSGSGELASLGRDFDRMAAQLQTLFEARRRLLHDVSHELKSPLARLQAATELLSRVPEQHASLIAHIERDTARMGQLISDLLTMARLDTGLAHAMDEHIDLNGLLTDLVEMSRFEALARGCELKLALDAPVLLRGSQELLYRALENVLRNAIRFSPAGAAVSVSTRCGQGRVQILVEDGGPGVPEAELAAIFEPFRRAQRERDPQGQGLGLAITRSVCEAHGGQARALNRPEGGLCVQLTLPLLAAAEEAR